MSIVPNSADWFERLEAENGRCCAAALRRGQRHAASFFAEEAGRARALAYETRDTRRVVDAAFISHYGGRG